MKVSISRRLLVVVSSLAIGGSSLIGNASAIEQPLFSDAVVFAGCVDVTPVQITPNNGSFNGPVPCPAPVFSSVPPICTIVSDDNIPPAVEAPYDCYSGLSFNGTYTNVVCGTGLASGLATIPEADSSYNVNFLIAFVAGQGVLVGNAATDDAFDVFTGPVDILPAAPLVPPCPVTNFHITTALVAIDSPVPAPIS
jgi:hypothetical protein